MPFQKGRSGNPNGRSKQSTEEKDQRKKFKELLKSSTVMALESIISIANDCYNKDRFNACKYIIDKAYGVNTAFLLDDEEMTQPIVIKVVSDRKDDTNTLDEEWEAEWNEAIDN